MIRSQYLQVTTTQHFNHFKREKITVKPILSGNPFFPSVSMSCAFSILKNSALLI